jgi:hypothetical protein
VTVRLSRPREGYPHDSHEIHQDPTESNKEFQCKVQYQPILPPLIPNHQEISRLTPPQTTKLLPLEFKERLRSIGLRSPNPRKSIAILKDKFEKLFTPEISTVPRPPQATNTAALPPLGSAVPATPITTAPASVFCREASSIDSLQVSNSSLVMNNGKVSGAELAAPTASRGVLGVISAQLMSGPGQREYRAGSFPPLIPPPPDPAARL